MVPVMIVKGGGAGLPPGHMTCDQICACFDPEIKLGKHSKMVGSLDGHQAEHIVPTSAFHQLGRGGDLVEGCEGYSTPQALTWMVGDGQSEGAEHKMLTDPMREFSQSNDLANQEATLDQWLDKYEEGTKNALNNSKTRKINDPKLDKKSLIDAAAKCIRERAKKSFDDMQPPVRGNTPLRNPWSATQEQIRQANVIPDAEV
jgi:hypothetical protein